LIISRTSLALSSRTSASRRASGGGALRAEEVDPGAGRLGHVQNVVEPDGQGVDLVPVEGRDERLVEVGHEAVDELVGLVLDRLQSLGIQPEILGGIQHRLDDLDAVDDPGADSVEKVEENFVPRNDRFQPSHLSSPAASRAERRLSRPRPSPGRNAGRSPGSSKAASVQPFESGIIAKAGGRRRQVSGIML